MRNRPCQPRPTLFKINSNELFYYPVTVSINRCGGNCKIIDDPCAWVCVADKVKSMNLKVFNLMSGANETRFLVQHKLCKCKCGLNESVCNSK